MCWKIEPHPSLPHSGALLLRFLGFLFAAAGRVGGGALLLVACTPRQTLDRPASVPSAEIAADQFRNDEVAALLEALSPTTSNGAALAAIEQIGAAKDARFVSVLIEVLRAAEVGILPITDFLAVPAGLESLTGESFGAVWPDWVNWYATTELEAPPGFVEWKGALYAAIDPEFEQFFNEAAPRRIRVEEIVWGGAGFEAIAALDNPKHVTIAQATYLGPEDLVFGIVINSDARAYPLRIMDWHEMANDVVGGTPVTLAYCTLCGAGILFESTIAGEATTFGTSGFLMRSNKLMYDRNTFTLWNQLTGEPVLGPLADSSERLRQLPIVLTTWDEWKRSQRETKVLDIDTGFGFGYEPGGAYGEYYAAGGTLFPAGAADGPLAEKERVFGLQVNGVPRAYPTEALTAEIVVNDIVGDVPVVLIAPGGDLVGSGVDFQSGQKVSWRAGATVRAYERGERVFAPGGDDQTLLDESGGSWLIAEDALVSADGERLNRLPGHLAYWFGWFNFFPQTSIYGRAAPP